MNELENETLNEQISAYVDGALSGRELASFEELLAANPDLVEKVELTRLMRQAARALPAARLPRSFTLPLNTKPTLSFWQRLFGDAAQAQKIMRFGSALATALFVFFAGMSLLNASAPPVRVALVEATPTGTSPAPMVMSAMEAPAAKVIPVPHGAPMLGGGGPDFGSLGGGPSGDLGEQTPDVVPTNAPLPTAIPSPTATPTATPTPVVSVPVPHTASLSWAWVAAALASLAAAVVLGVLGWRRQR